METALILTYDKANPKRDKACLVVSKIINDQLFVCNVILDEDATKIYELLKGDLK